MAAQPPVASSPRSQGLGRRQEDSDSDDPSDSEAHHLDLDTDLRDIRKSTLKYLNYTTKYVSDWSINEAFRETYQNWRDGILRSFNLSPSDFSTTTEETGRAILIKATKTDSEELLGFIHFRYDSDGNCVGGLQLANFKATLPYRSLGTGATSKAGDTNQTGQHGEGMKLSALVFRRNNYNFRIESGEFKWNFIFKRKELACNLRRIPAQTLGRLKRKDTGKDRGAIAHPWEDVCVIVGAPGSSRTIHGEKVKSRILHVDDFRQMLKVTLDINAPNKLVRTPHGDLIVDPRYRGKMYLRGLLLPSGGMCGESYAYGYNFVDGTTTRDRNTLARHGEESKSIAAIWASAIETDTSENSDLLTEYTNLLLHSLNAKGDAMLSWDRNCLTKATAQKVWRKMRTMNHDQQGRPAFYYLDVEGGDQVHIIKQSLNNNPVPLELELWDMLAEYKLCRTPSEEVLHRFRFGKTIDVPAHPFGMHVNTMLHYLLQSSHHTRDMRLSFVDGKMLHIDAGLSGSTWRIHNKWLSYNGAHEHVYCEETSSECQQLFVCDHVVLQLWDIMIGQLQASGEHGCIAKDEGWLKSMARARLSQMPRAVKCAQTDFAGELHVTWESVDSHRNKHQRVVVELHSNTCTTKVESRVQQRFYEADGNRNCDCPWETSTAVSYGVTFDNLESTESYSARVSRYYDGAFFALQSKPVKLLDTDRFKITRPPQRPDTSKTSKPLGAVDAENHNGSSTSPTMSEHSESEESVEAPGHRGSRARTASSPTPNCSSEALGDTIMECDSPSGEHSVAPGMSVAASLPPFTHNASVQINPLSVREASVQTTVPPHSEVYLLGDQIEHGNLNWGGGFPGSHNFYRARNTADEDVLIARPKQKADKASMKRPTQQHSPGPARKRPRTQANTPNEREDIAESLRSIAASLRTQTSYLTTRERSEVSRRAAPSITPLPEGGITYRY